MVFGNSQCDFQYVWFISLLSRQKVSELSKRFKRSQKVSWSLNFRSLNPNGLSLFVAFLREAALLITKRDVYSGYMLC